MKRRLGFIFSIVFSAYLLWPYVYGLIRVSLSEYESSSTFSGDISPNVNSGDLDSNYEDVRVAHNPSDRRKAAELLVESENQRRKKILQDESEITEQRAQLKASKSLEEIQAILSIPTAQP